MTWPVERDLEALLDDIAKARELADVVLVSLHWGVHFAPALIADYQPVVAHAAIDAGAAAIIGHHPHILKAIEVYRGRPIFYSLGNFVLDSNSGYRPTDHFWRNKLKAAYTRYGAPGPYDERGLEEANYSMIAKLEITSGVLQRVSFRPVIIENKTPMLYSAADPQGAQVLRYVREITETAGLPTLFRVDGDDIVVDME
jgi:poly-gamma-glutamate synthesis protein (capsule biosynthesis protein)